MNYSAFVLIVLFVCFSSIGVSLGLDLSCKDEKNQNVDWFINYKLPKIEKGFPGTLLSMGKAYSYIISNHPKNWTMSSKSITSDESMFAKTLKLVFDNKKTVSYLFYNDEPPAGFNGTSNGHLKGVVAFDATSGFWLIHSVPKFSELDKYSYPSNAIENGQSALCVTFKTSTLNEICKQLLYCMPKIYGRQLTDEVEQYLDENSKSIFSDKPAYIRQEPYKNIATLKSSKKEVFMSFVKSQQLNDDLYSGVVAPSLKSSLIAETWRRGSGTYLPPYCDSKYFVIDAQSITMKINSKESINYKSTEDHSKWAVSSEATQSWICIGDINRMKSQEKRGGGTLCFQSMEVGNAYRSIVNSTDECPDSA